MTSGERLNIASDSRPEIALARSKKSSSRVSRVHSIVRCRGTGGCDMGDQFIALSKGRTQPPDQARHFGLVVDDNDAVRARLEELGVRIFGRLRLDFYDPWGNLVQVVDYRDVQFTKADAVLRAQGLKGLKKSERAREELRAKGISTR
jgi:lactoylglutathione lyase